MPALSLTVPVQLGGGGTKEAHTAGNGSGGRNWEGKMGQGKGVCKNKLFRAHGMPKPTTNPTKLNWTTCQSCLLFTVWEMGQLGSQTITGKVGSLDKGLGKKAWPVTVIVVGGGTNNGSGAIRVSKPVCVGKGTTGKLGWEYNWE